MAVEATTALVGAIAMGAGLGFFGAVSPGPLQTIIVSETLANGARSAWRAAFAPVCTDPFALALALFVVSNISGGALACVAFAGAALLFRIAWAEFRTTEADFDFSQKPRRPFYLIVALNFLNPNLWIYSFTVNALNVSAFQRDCGWGVASTYLLAFFVSITLCNLAIVFLVAGLKTFFNARWLVYVNRALSVFLTVVALRFIWLGCEKLGLIDSAATETARLAFAFCGA